MNHRRILIALFACQMAIQFASSALAMYDPGLGRFCSRDPIGYVGSEWGLYEYVDSKPVDDMDPNGEISFLRIYQKRIRGVREICKTCYFDKGYCVADVEETSWQESQVRRLLPAPVHTGNWNEVPNSRRSVRYKDYNADCCSSCAEIGDVRSTCDTSYTFLTKWQRYYPPPPPPSKLPWA